MAGNVATYSSRAMFLHWSIATLLAYNYALGLRTQDRADVAQLYSVYQMHKSIGMLVLLLTAWRIWVRLRRVETIAISAGGWAGKLASCVHFAFYAIMIGLPVTGWVIVSTADVRVPTMLFGVIPWPHLPLAALAPWIGKPTVNAHELLSNAALALVALHVLGVLRHLLVLRDALLQRMMPFPMHGLAFFALALAVIGGGFGLGKLGPPWPSVTPPSNAQPTIAYKERDRDLADPAGGVNLKDRVGPDKAVPSDPATLVAADQPSDNWRVSPGGRLGFLVTVNGDAVKGRFQRWHADITFDPARPRRGSIDVVIDLATATTGDGERDAMLVGEDFLATASYPSARLSIRDAKENGPGRYSAAGRLTMKGVSHPIRIAFSLKISGDEARVSGNATIKRNEFLVGIGQWTGDEMIGNQVVVDFNFLAHRTSLATAP